MKLIAFPLAGTLALLGACATPAYVSPVEVTRFVAPSASTLGQGTISIAAAPGVDSNSLEFATYTEAVRRELETLGYRVVAQGGAQVAQVSLSSAVAEGDGRRGSGIGVGVGGSTGGYRSGVGAGVGIDLTRLLNGRPADRIERVLSVAIRPAAGGTNLWEGRAGMVASADSDYAADAAAAGRLAHGLFSGFPGESGETIAVE